MIAFIPSIVALLAFVVFAAVVIRVRRKLARRDDEMSRQAREYHRKVWGCAHEEEEG